MVRYKLEILGSLENVKELYTDPDLTTRWYIKLHCTNCGETPGIDNQWVYFNGEMHDASNGQQANFVGKCKECKREMTLRILPNTLQPYVFDDDIQPRYRSILEVEARGMKPTEYDFRAGWNAKSSISTTVFSDLEFNECHQSGKDWVDYDSVANQEVAAYNLQSRFVRMPN